MTAAIDCDAVATHSKNALEDILSAHEEVATARDELKFVNAVEADDEFCVVVVDTDEDIAAMEAVIAITVVVNDAETVTTEAEMAAIDAVVAMFVVVNEELSAVTSVDTEELKFVLAVDSEPL